MGDAEPVDRLRHTVDRLQFSTEPRIKRLAHGLEKRRVDCQPIRVMQDFRHAFQAAAEKSLMRLLRAHGHTRRRQGLDENRKRTPVVVIEPRGFNALSITTPDGKPVALDKGDSNFVGVTPVQVQDPHFDQEQEDAFLREFLGKDGE